MDMLIASLNATLQADPNAKVNLVRMLNLTTFDIMGDLTFRDSLELLAGTSNIN